MYSCIDSCIGCSGFQCTDNKHCDIIDYVSSGIVQSCLEAAHETLPFSSSKVKKGKCIPGWNDKVEPLKRDALFWHSIWRSCGSPALGIVASIRRRTRALYHRAIKSCLRDRDKFIANKIAEAHLEKDNSSFWNHVKNVNKVKHSVPSSIDNVCGEENIANKFAQNYNSLYNSAVSSDDDICGLFENLDNQIVNKCKNNNCNNSHFVSKDDVVKAIVKLKSNKSDGFYGHNSNHIIHGTDKLYDLIAGLLTGMLQHGYASPEFRMSLMVPIVKSNQKSVSDSSNYRAIALSNIISKIADIIIIDKQQDIFTSSDFQFGFTEKCSTTQCTFVVNEVVQYYLNNGGKVFTTFLDASKAFDTVQFHKLFRLIIDKGICPLIARLLAFCYFNQSCCVKWCSSTSKQFSINNGVKQGGVLSPLLFNIYLDVLLEKLRKCGYGCHIGNSYMGSFAYADDIVLLSPTVASLQAQLDICEHFSNIYNIKFNTSKSKLLVYGDKSVVINFQGHVIPVCESEKHVGNIVGSNHNIYTEMIKNACNDIYSKFNLLIRQFRSVDKLILYKLFNTYCLSLYGCQLWKFSSSKIMEPLYVAWRKCVRVILGVPYNTHCNLLHLIVQDQSLDFKLHNRFIKFMHGICISSNKCVALCANLLSMGSCSTVSTTWNFICCKYNLDRSALKTLNTYLLKLSPPNPNENVQITAGLIRDLLLYYDDTFDEDVLDIINYLCTD